MKNNLSMLVLLVLPILLGFGSCSSGPRFLERIPGGVLDGEVVGSVVEDWVLVPVVVVRAFLREYLAVCSMVRLLEALSRIGVLSQMQGSAIWKRGQIFPTRSS